MSTTPPARLAGGRVPERPVLVVRLGGERFGVPLPSVEEVSRPAPLTRVPRTPPWLAGVANSRGRVLPVADVRAQMGLARPDTVARRARCVLLREGEVRLGLLTEGVDGVVGLPPALDPVLATLPAGARALLAGSAATTVGPLPVLSVAALLGLRGQLASPARSAAA